MKVFGVGLSRSGTSSLASGLDVLGYRVRHFPSLVLLFGKLSIRRREFERYDAMADLPIAHFYKDLDRRFPGSKFIHTVRDVESWLDSCERFRRFEPDFKAKRRIMELRRQFFGVTCFDRERFRDVHARHTQEVRDYFRDRPDDLLELRICEGEGFAELCPFLGKPQPGVGFPHKNAGAPRPTSVA